MNSINIINQMIVETMSTKEIISNVITEIDTLNNRITNYFHKNFRKNLLRSDKYPFVFRHETVTKNGNKYISFGLVTSRRMALRNIFLIMTFLVVETDHGKMLIRIGGHDEKDMLLTYFEPHFWSRYRERMEMGDIPFKDMLFKFVKRNCYQGFPIQKLRNDNVEYEVAINDGSMMMQMIDGKLTAKTFISTKTFGKMKQERHEDSAKGLLQMDQMDSLTRKMLASEKQRHLNEAC